MVCLWELLGHLLFYMPPPAHSLGLACAASMELSRQSFGDRAHVHWLHTQGPQLQIQRQIRQGQYDLGQTHCTVVLGGGVSLQAAGLPSCSTSYKKKKNKQQQQQMQECWGSWFQPIRSRQSQGSNQVSQHACCAFSRVGCAFMKSVWAADACTFIMHSGEL